MTTLSQFGGLVSNPLYSEYIHLSRYSRWVPSLSRREIWHETVYRYIEFWRLRFPQVEDSVFDQLYQSILTIKTMPSMRALMTAGAALERDNVAGFNCSYLTVSGEGEAITLTDARLDSPVTVHLSKPIDFDEAMYILMCGTGVGFSVERQYVNHLPKVGKPLNRRITLPFSKNYPGCNLTDISTIDRKLNIITVEDSKYGWASALRILIVELYNGNFSVEWDLSKIRPAGAPLRTFGGRASGPAPLDDLFHFAVDMFKEANGRKLTSIECHDLMCKIADVVVVGGVRRSALISLSNLTDERMRSAKSGAWWETNPQRALSNNSVCYTEKPDVAVYMREMLALYESKTGERGVFNRESAQKQAARNGRRDPTYDFGTNPCSEIILRPKQFCNLTEVVVREEDTLDDLKQKVINATIMGTLQATLTDFIYLQDDWRENTKEEALLGVSLTGIMDHPILNNVSPELTFWLRELRRVAIETNEIWAAKLGINTSAAITCVKPSGTVSQLVDSASGIHPRYSNFYIRRVRSDNKDPLTRLMIDYGFPHEPDVFNPNVTVFSFPMKAPDSAIVTKQITAIQQLELWKAYQLEWCEHKPSITVFYKNHEFTNILAWVYSNFDLASGVSFLPYDDHTYVQAPYEEINEEMYNTMVSLMPINVNWGDLSKYETRDNTTSSKELACTGNKCEI